MIAKLLIANRGEIACRIIQTCKKLGIETVAVYSDADQNALHTKLADTAYHLGGAAPTESYLNGAKILEITKRSGADAIHPGYGFLSENTQFARACADAGVIFVGPSPDTMDKMASKADAKALMEAAGVPVVPGYHSDAQDEDTLKQAAENVGFPLMIKASAGGGGKGMRIVREASDFLPQLHSAKREAKNAFGDDRVILERYIENPRHLEVQVFGDQMGNIVHVFERDCSSQRRYQKVIEESPAPLISQDVRSRLLQAGVDAAKAVDYINAGTVEFIAPGDSLDEDGEFFFMEMNTRLQVEHPVTELVTGIDLVDWQLRVAAGEPLPLNQDQISASGHAMEARLYAEDAAKGFLPASGTINDVAFPDFARIDTGVTSNSEVTVHYDPMIAKIIVHGKTRDAAINALRLALAHTQVSGLTTNQDFLYALASSEPFQKFSMHTGLLDDQLDAIYTAGAAPSAHAVIFAAVCVLLNRETDSSAVQATTTDPHSPWSVSDAWRLGHAGERVISLQLGAEHYRLAARGHSGNYHLQLDSELNEDSPTASALTGGGISISGAHWNGSKISLQLDAQTVTASAMLVGSDIQVAWNNRLLKFSPEDPYAPALSAGASGDQIVAPMPGKIVAIKSAPEQEVSSGDVLIIMEAMKMELSLEAPRDGLIQEISASEGDFVEADAVLLTLKQD